MLKKKTFLERENLLKAKLYTDDYTQKNSWDGFEYWVSKNVMIENVLSHEAANKN